MLESVESTEGLFVTYSWPKEINGHPEIKTSYCYYLPEFDIVVGAGVYHSDIDKSVMDNVYQRLNTYYENEEDYIFVMSNDGICKVHAEPEMIDSDITGTFNHDGRNLHDMFVETSKEDEGGFVSYTYNKLDEATVLEKISYTIALDDWDAYLAMGFYTEDLLEVNDLNESELESQNSKENFIVTIGLTIVIILVLLLIRKGSYLQSELMRQEEAIFSELLKQVTEGIVIMGERKVLYANDKAVTLFGHHVEDTFNRGIEYLKNDDDVYEIENENATYYVEISKKNLLYKGIDSEMYLAKNITNTYLQAHNYQRISMIDELSGLQNRRALIRDFTEKSTNKTCKRVIGLIDLDFFKNVNDSYGHERGDDIIVDLGELFTNRLRKTDKFYRYGGEEFVVLFMNISIIEAKEVLEKLNEEMKQMSLKKYGFEQTFSGGIVSIQNEVSIDLDGYISKADKLMYQAKLKGRNRIEFELDSDNI